MIIDKPELLAPAGGVKALRAAVQSGADAVYLGADRFSARAGADNFTMDSLEGWIDYCHLRGVSVHLAANTLVKEREARDFLSYICTAYRLGIDAVIVQDIGMAAEIKRLCPELSLHASTQMTVTCAEGVKYLESMGFERVVLARELTAREIMEIRRRTKAELEVFVHGALCFCYSGQCLMSGIIGQRSGNRGQCAQPCRLPYELEKDKKCVKQGYLLSPKDLCLAARLNELCEAGINSFKIEGRLKSAEYVATAVGVYRKCLDGKSFTQEDRNALLGAFNRSGFTEGWYGCARDMMSGKSPSNVAKNTAGAEYVKYTAENADFRKTGVSIFAELYNGEPLSLTLLDRRGNSASVCGDVAAEQAENTPLSKERITKQLQRLGGSAFFAENVEISMDEGVTIPIGEINAVRRRAAEQLAEACRLSYKRSAVSPEFSESAPRKSKTPYIVAVCANEEQARAAAACGVKRIAAPRDTAERLFKQVDCEVITLLDNIGAGARPQTDGVMVMNTAQIAANADKKLYGGFRLNIYNSSSAEVFGAMEAITLSCELNLKEIRAVGANAPCEVIAYGRLPLMLMRNCPARVHGACRGKGGFSLKDRKGESFLIRCGENCTSELLNSKTVYMADKMPDIMKAGADGIQLWFYNENAETVKKVITAYKEGMRGAGPAPEIEFTRGHFYRGVV